MVLRLPRLRDNLREHDAWRKTVNCWDMLLVLVSPPPQFMGVRIQVGMSNSNWSQKIFMLTLYCFLFLGFISSLIFVLKSAKFKSHLFLKKAIVSLGEKGKVWFCIIHSPEREWKCLLRGDIWGIQTLIKGLMIGNLLE